MDTRWGGKVRPENDALDKSDFPRAASSQERARASERKCRLEMPSGERITAGYREGLKHYKRY